MNEYQQTMLEMLENNDFRQCVFMTGRRSGKSTVSYWYQKYLESTYHDVAPINQFEGKDDLFEI